MGSRVAVRVSIVPFFHMWDGFFYILARVTLEGDP